jgi:uncharacterized membrane protein YoaK (UPF0700 family)
VQTAFQTTFGEVRGTLVPDLSGPHGPLPPLLLGLTLVTGLVDAFSYLVLGHVFVANMTGNVVFMAFSLAGAGGFSVLASVLSLVSFMVGAAAGGLLANRVTAHRGRLLLSAAAGQTVLVLAAWVLGRLVHLPAGHGARWALIVLLGLPMGVQNAVVRRLAVPDLTTTVLTLTITGVAADSRLAGGKGGKVGRRALSAAAMFAGGLAGAVAVEHGGRALPLLFAAVLLVAASATAFVLTRSDASWTKPL